MWGFASQQGDSSYSRDSQVRLVGEIPSLGAHFVGESLLNPRHIPAVG